MNACPTPDELSRFRGGTLNSAANIRAIEEHLRYCSSCRNSLRSQMAYATVSLSAHLLPFPDEALHLDNEQMQAFVRGKLEGVELEIVQSHLDLCGQCRAEVADLQTFHRLMQEEQFRAVDEHLTHPSWHERWEAAFASFLHAFGIGSLQSAITWWNQKTLNFRLVLGVVLGLIVGYALRGHTEILNNVPGYFLKLLQTLAIPFIFVAIVHTLMDTDITGRTARRLVYLALSNTLVAVCIGLLIGNIAVWAGLFVPITPHPGANTHPLVPIHSPDNSILIAVLMAVAVGLALRVFRHEQMEAKQNDYVVISSLLSSAFRCLTIMLNWIVGLVPVAVFAVVADLVGQFKWQEFASLIRFSGAVVTALLIQITFYLLRLWFRAAMPPQKFLHGAWLAVLTAFSTASSIATLPITYMSVRDRVGVKERSAGLGVLVGAQFNRDGTALYEAIAPLFMAQAILGHTLDLSQQLMVLGTAIIASIAAPGVPQAGLITMLLVFEAAGLDAKYIPMLLPLDWLLDRCRTAVNVLGGITVTCLLDRRSIPYSSHDHEDDIQEEVIVPEVIN